nr:MAG TPA: hypothetical protein [Caudoviricetes sp.]
MLLSKAVRNGKPPCGFCVCGGQMRSCPLRFLLAAWGLRGVAAAWLCIRPQPG